MRIIKKSIAIRLAFIAGLNTMFGLESFYLFKPNYTDKPELLYTDKNYSIIDYTGMTYNQQGVDCGLHGLKNSIALYGYLAGDITFEDRTRILQSNEIPSLGSMPSCRIAINKTSGMLDPEEILMLTEKLASPYNNALLNERLLLLDNLANPTLMRSSKEVKQLADTAEHVQKDQPYLQAFVLADMNQLGDAGNQASGHWIAAVLQVHGTGKPATLHMANSLTSLSSRNASLRFDERLGKQLMAFLSTAHPDELRFKSLEDLKVSLGNNTSKELFEAALIDANNLIHEARYQNILSSERFANEYIPIIERALQQTPDSVLNEQYKELKRYISSFFNDNYSIKRWNPPAVGNIAQDLPTDIDKSPEQSEKPITQEEFDFKVSDEKLARMLQDEELEAYRQELLQKERTAQQIKADELLAQQFAAEEAAREEQIRSDEALARALAEDDLDFLYHTSMYH